MELSVIIVSYNVRYFLEQCLLSVRKASENIRCEIFVVDNNSEDTSCSMVSGQFPEVKLIRNTENKGFSAANNQALRIASGKYILLLNPDTLVEENTFTSCISFMNEHPEAGAAGVKMINGKGKFLPESKRALPDPKTAFFKIFGLSYLFPKSKFFNNYYLGHLDSRKIAKVDVLTGAFMFLRREAVLKTGFLDEDFFMYGEDIDYSYRIIREGFINYYYPETRIIHFKGESTKKDNLNVLISFYKAMIIFVRKHYNNSNLKVFILPVKMAIFFRATLSLLKNFVIKISQPAIGLCRLISSFSGKKISLNPFKKSKRTLIVSDKSGYKCITELMIDSGISSRIAGRVSINPQDLSEEVLGNIEQIREIIRINKIRELIFNASGMSTSLIIDLLQLTSDLRIRTRIASSEGKYLLGSKYAKPAENFIKRNTPKSGV
ncbi:MAG: glycosyltransferase family 2 protein [Bacteroidales bacterium]|nr:glycosyltransferase family 2 protein [Bacteroidales bacterium]